MLFSPPTIDSWLPEIRQNLDKVAPAAFLINQELILKRCEALKELLPGAKHSFAIKALPLPKILDKIVKTGFMLEAASAGEIALAGDARILFDAPVKTKNDIELALEKNAIISADSYCELEMLPPNTIALLRVNPNVGGGAITYTSTATKDSKFGVPIDALVLKAFKNYSSLKGLHFHVGSQGIGVPLLIEAAKKVCELVKSINQAKYINIGGGLPVSYKRGEEKEAHLDYFPVIKDLFGRFLERGNFFTEFGRYIAAHVGVLVARVLKVKGTIAYISVGADGFVRESYRPNDWYHDIFVLSSDGALKESNSVPQTIAGPLCFQGDLLCANRNLPKIEVGDLIVVADVGAYTFSMWSRYNSRPMPGIYGVDGTVLKKPETTEDIIRFWS